MRNIYELSYWVKREGDNEKLHKIFKEMDLELIKEIPAKEKTPAYPIKKETLALFGTFYFYADQDKIENLKERVKTLPDILRFIILKRGFFKINNNPGSPTNESE